MNIGAFSCLYLMRKDGEYKENISDLSGISKKHPLLAISFLIILFSLAGIPPLRRFFCKILYFYICFRTKNVYISNNWFTNHSHFSSLLFKNN